MNKYNLKIFVVFFKKNKSYAFQITFLLRVSKKKKKINLKQSEETRNAKQFYQEYEFKDNVLDRILQLKLI